MFERIIETDQNSDITLKVNNKEPLFISINVNRYNSRSGNNSMSEMITPCHQLQNKRQKTVHEYSQKSIDDFMLIIVNPSQNLTYQEKISTMFFFSLLKINVLKLTQR